MDTVVFGQLLLDAVREEQNLGIIRSGDAEQQAQLLWAGLHGCIALPINFDRIEVSDTQTLAGGMMVALMSKLTNVDLK